MSEANRTQSCDYFRLVRLLTSLLRGRDLMREYTCSRRGAAEAIDQKMRANSVIVLVVN